MVTVQSLRFLCVVVVANLLAVIPRADSQSLSSVVSVQGSSDQLVELGNEISELVRLSSDERDIASLSPQLDGVDIASLAESSGLRKQIDSVTLVSMNIEAPLFKGSEPLTAINHLS